MSRPFRPLVLALAVAAASSACAHKGYDDQKDYDAGAAYVREKLDEARHGQVDQSFFSFLVIQTRLTSRSGDWATAVHTAEPLVQMDEIVYGPDSLQLANDLMTLADVYANLDRLPEAEAPLQRAVSITRKHQADDPVAHIRALNSLGATYDLLSRPEEAEPVLVEALGLAEQRFGADSPEVGVTAWLLSASYSAQGDAEKASALRARAERLLPKKPPTK